MSTEVLIDQPPPSPLSGRALVRATALGEARRRVDPTLAREVEGVIGAAATSIADRLFAVLLGLEEARLFLHPELVGPRLHAALVGWLRSLLAIDEMSELEWIERQYTIGRVHARIDLPLHLIGTAIRLLRRELGTTLLGAGWSRETTLLAMLWVDEHLDLVVECMDDAYVGDIATQARGRQTLQVVLGEEQLSLECERLRASLFDWERRAILALVEGRAQQVPAELAASGFILWLDHKAPLALGETRDLADLRAAGKSLVEGAAATCAAWPTAAPGEQAALAKELHQEVSRLAYLLASLAERISRSQAGRDPLTKLLNRRHLPAVLQQEIAVSRRSGRPFAVILTDVDHFKLVNDEFGHSTGDRLLERLAESLHNGIRSGDFAFRYGGEEFLLVLTEIEPGAVRQRAEALRAAAAELRVPTEGSAEARLTLSVGVAVFAGHPDYERLLRAADEALYRAKLDGRNRVVVAD